MIHYIKIALRNLRRHPLYTGLNVAGLAIGLAVCMAIVLFIRYETSYDSHFRGADRLYRVVMQEEDASGSSINSALPEPVIPGLDASFPEVEAGARVSETYGEILVRAGETALYETRLLQAEPAFFSLFPAQVVHGSLNGVLEQPGGMVLTVSSALKYFGTTDVVGREMSTDHPYYGVNQYTVRAVVEDPAASTHLPYDFVVHRSENDQNRWNYFFGPGYVRLAENASPADFEAKLPAWVEANAYYDYPRDTMPVLRLQPVTDIHLYPEWGTASAGIGPIQYLQMFGLAAFLILLIAVVNFVNLATARAATRAKEMGVRKSVGALRRQLIVQLLGEAFTFTFAAFAAALILTYFMVSMINERTGMELAMVREQAGVLIVLGLGVILVTGLLSGLYPAWYLSSFQPISTLKGQWIRSASGRNLRKGLVVFQFVTSIVLCVGTITIQQQMEFVRSERLNSLDQQIIMVKNGNLLGGVYNDFKANLLAEPEIAAMTTASAAPGTVNGWATYADEETGTTMRMAFVTVGDDYLETLGLDLIAGDPFTPELIGSLSLPTSEAITVGTSQTPRAVIFNQEAVTGLSLEDPVGAYVGRFNVHVIGVVENFHFQSLYEPVYPVQLQYQPDRAFSTLMIRFEKGQIASGLDKVQAAWAGFEGDHPLNFVFLDDELDAAYRSEMQLFNIFGGFAVLALVVACLGLFGLVTSMVETRTKEIGIRKTLGATAARIVWLLSQDFLRLIVVAFVIGAPVAYYFLQRWLEEFEYHLEPGLMLFALGGGIAVLVALITVGYQVTAAALSNPVNALRHE